jgi:hypothetical protein
MVNTGRYYRHYLHATIVFISSFCTTHCADTILASNIITYNHSLPLLRTGSYQYSSISSSYGCLISFPASRFRSDILLVVSTPNEQPPRLQPASFDAPWHFCTLLSSHSCSCACCDVLRPTGKA